MFLCWLPMCCRRRCSSRLTRTAAGSSLWMRCARAEHAVMLLLILGQWASSLQLLPLVSKFLIWHADHSGWHLTSGMPITITDRLLLIGVARWLKKCWAPQLPTPATCKSCWRPPCFADPSADMLGAVPLACSTQPTSPLSLCCSYAELWTSWACKCRRGRPSC